MQSFENICIEHITYKLPNTIKIQICLAIPWKENHHKQTYNCYLRGPWAPLSHPPITHATSTIPPSQRMEIQLIS